MKMNEKLIFDESDKVCPNLSQNLILFLTFQKQHLAQMENISKIYKFSDEIQQMENLLKNSDCDEKEVKSIINFTKNLKSKIQTVEKKCCQIIEKK